ncbi:hypothetical protein F4820DRAFT_174615 [Hypoxylon rubiginosum]|uniref:Uncharacterized protein n=1 Tax=Hypoxylon rubiginosum TaxID=110542 RepID=A0ACB9YJA3_9PEZI|nr:hypothetical protein F4820DRAFT_174615 [Hypoxylon rubiginosum]
MPFCSFLAFGLSSCHISILPLIVLALYPPVGLISPLDILPSSIQTLIPITTASARCFASFTGYVPVSYTYCAGSLSRLASSLISRPPHH